MYEFCHCFLVPFFAFQSSSTGIPAIIELGSSCAAEFTGSLALTLRAKSVSETKKGSILQNVLFMKEKPLLQVIKTTPKHINQAYNKWWQFVVSSKWKN